VTAVGQSPLGRQGHRADDAVRPGLPLQVLFCGLVLYLAFGKGFAYAGWPPVFAGEVLLVVVVAATAVSTSMAVPHHPAAMVTVVVSALALVQFVIDRLAGDVPLLETVRGLAPVYYGAYAFAVYALLREFEKRTDRARVLAAIDGAFVRVAPWVTGAAVVLAGLLLVEPTTLPTWPGSGVPVLLTKSGDIAVALVLFAPFVLRSASPVRIRGASRIVVVAWVVAAVLVSFRSRGAALALVVGLVASRPAVVRIAKTALIGLAIVLFLFVSGLRVEVSGREISYDAVGDAVGSVIGGRPEDQIGSNYLDTTNWRADWWRSIWSDVTAEQLVLHGRGWGDNLAVRHGVIPAFAGEDPRALRLPHDVFFSLAGRAGLVTAVGFLTVPVLTIARSYRRRSDRSPTPRVVQAARGGVAAAVTTGLTDIYLESPQGGIVFWVLIGFLWWAVAQPMADAPVRHR
jgi:hypothetical protein